LILITDQFDGGNFRVAGWSVRVASAVEIAAWQKEFSWTAVAEKYLNVFNSLN
jgi:hypothetical protein